MKDYLLGILDERKAAVLEEKYFTDPDFFRQVQAVETSLIEAYLLGRLAPADRGRFEARYLNAPLLERRVNEVRERLGASARLKETPGFAWRWALAAVVLAGIVALPVIYWVARPPHAPTIAKRPPSVVAPVIMARLSPGVVKGSAHTTEFTVPATATVRFALELPGRTTPQAYMVRLISISKDGSRKTSWMSGPLQPIPTATGSDLIFDLSGSHLSPGDYVTEAAGPSGATIETYAFRVNPER